MTDGRMSHGPILMIDDDETVLRDIAARDAPPVAEAPAEAGVAFGARLPALKALTASLIEEALLRANGSQAAAAQFLGISRQALNKRLRRNGSGEPRPPPQPA